MRNQVLYDRDRAERLLPLLESITREIAEREAAIDVLEALLYRLDDPPANQRQYTQRLVADLAVHRRELRHAMQELDRLGCSVIGGSPLTVRIPGAVGDRRRSFLWTSGDLVLH